MQNGLTKTDTPLTALAGGDRMTARALLVGDRIDVAGLERTDVLSNSPFAFRAGASGVAVLFRYGVVVFAGLTPLEEDEVLRSLQPRIFGDTKLREEETAQIEISSDKDDLIPPGGPVYLKALSVERALLVADALAKSVALARSEREVSAVFGVIEPFARELADNGRTPGGRRAMLRHIGKALLVQQQVSGQVAVAEKPDALWDRPDLDRLYARLEGEYELKERSDALGRKLTVISDTAQALTDIIDTQRSLRLEQIIVALILIEIVMSTYQMLIGR